jgi:hypothetical protein
MLWFSIFLVCSLLSLVHIITFHFFLDILGGFYCEMGCKESWVEPMSDGCWYIQSFDLGFGFEFTTKVYWCRAFGLLEKRINYELGISFFLSKKLLLEFMSPWCTPFFLLDFLAEKLKDMGRVAFFFLSYSIFTLF